MLNWVRALNTFLGLLLTLAVLAGVAYGAWTFYRTRYNDLFALDEAHKNIARQEERIAALASEVKRRDTELAARQREIAELTANVKRQEAEIQRLDLSLRLLKVDHRLARIEVLRQEGSATDGSLTTEFSFVEIDPEGRPREEPRVFRIEGDIVYIDSWVVKFVDEHVEEGDPLRSTSICLFRRLFGERQPAIEGFVLDSEGTGPTAYRSGGKPSAFEQELWSRFWDYANDPARAEEAGVRAAHGEAPFIKMKPGHRYQVQLRASGGLSITPEPVAMPSKPTT